MAGYGSMNDLELIALTGCDDQQAFAELYARYFDALYLHACQRLRDKAEAKDLVQELFSHLWSQRHALSTTEHFSSYLYKAIRNRVLNLLAHKAVEAKFLVNLQYTGNGTEAVTDHLAREHQLARVVEQEIQSLPPRMRQVFELSRKQHMPYKEIGMLLNLSEQSVRSHIKGALKLLRTRLGLWLYLAMLLWLS
ncbi:RNA polymerase subunit sigma-70 [Chitinophaga parva]|uniref:RNA polymerase subunit sigma-70 n=1 Tax=Chitinophaga parva TaxID=2169414 RepID=A0A2T7BD44_9BACT|nr:RNA polymerase sigma-70 factor [Chitinophaga parva]PUZ23014.1 RNA polymerase subunit sigma-70 [Chitinophaga parva]